MPSQSDMDLEPPAELTSRVMRRAQVSNMTRALQSSLALANVKIKHGWENISINALEPRIAHELNRKRPVSSHGTTLSSSSSSSVSDSSRLGPDRALASSPLTATMFSDENDPGLSSSRPSSKRRRTSLAHPRYPASSNQAGRKSRSAAAVRSWKRNHDLAESSPARQLQHPPQRCRVAFHPTEDLVPGGSSSPVLSEADESDLPVSSFTLQASVLTASSPPRTPQQERRMIHKAANISWSRTPRTGEEGADLLMYLATSPTPALTTVNRMHPPSAVPSTPPSMHTSLLSSLPQTLGYTGLFNVPNTPSNNINFADFCNVTPSPARTQWPKTPATAILRTPQATTSAKRRFNVEHAAAHRLVLSPSADKGDFRNAVD